MHQRFKVMSGAHRKARGRSMEFCGLNFYFNNRVSFSMTSECDINPAQTPTSERKKMFEKATRQIGDPALALERREGMWQYAKQQFDQHGIHSALLALECWWTSFCQAGVDISWKQTN